MLPTRNPGTGTSGLEVRAESKRLQSLAENFRPHKPQPKTGFTKRAAVLACLFRGDGGDLRVILTKRSSNLSSHSGEVSLPGGKVEEGDGDDVVTALREAKEEIGLDPSQVNVVTVLEPFVTKACGTSTATALAAGPSPSGCSKVAANRATGAH